MLELIAGTKINCAVLGGGADKFFRCLDGIGGVLGVIAGGGSDTQLQAACGFAGALGLAFQIRDDMLDVIGTKEEMGKGVGTDSNKNTFVHLYGIEKCNEMVQYHTDKAIKQLSAFKNVEFMNLLAEKLTSRIS